jgi:NAD(P)-dependent dehydrogenase (short-subunit alcohol dehydrogenase family)
VPSPAALLADRVALVTGAGAGIGKAIARGFAAAGACVTVLERDETAARATVAEIAAAGGDALAVPADVRDPDAVAAGVAATIARYGGVDVLVNNVGGTFRAALLDTNDKGWDALIRANLKTVVHGTRAVAPRMIEQGRGGSILNIVSIEGLRAAPLYAAYAACKAAVVNFTASAALELGVHGIRVNALAPDVVLTEGVRPLLAGMDPERWRAAIPLGRAGEPDDIAGPAVFLASDLARYVTGVVLHVDGGTHAAAGWYRDATTGEWSVGPPRARS